MTTIELLCTCLATPENISLEFKTAANQFSRDKHLTVNYNVKTKNKINIKKR